MSENFINRFVLRIFLNNDEINLKLFFKEFDTFEYQSINGKINLKFSKLVNNDFYKIQ